MKVMRQTLFSLCFTAALAAAGLGSSKARADDPSAARRLDGTTAERAGNVRITYEFGPFLTPGDIVDFILDPRKTEGGGEAEPRIVLTGKKVYAVNPWRCRGLPTVTVPFTEREAAAFSQAAREGRLRPIMRESVAPVILRPACRVVPAPPDTEAQ